MELVIKWLAENWRIAVMAILIGLVALFFNMWRDEVEDFAKFKGEVAAAGEAQKAETQRINDRHQKTLEDVSNAWNNQLQPARDGAVAAYQRRHPVGVSDSGSGQVSGRAGSDQGNDAAGQEQMAVVPACQPDRQFIADCAEDALKVGVWQLFATENNLPVR